MRRNGLLMSFIRQAFCRHEYEFVRNIYGDEIIQWNWNRSIWRCRKCKKLIGRDFLFFDEKGGGA